MLEHTFAICAYKESEYLEECIRSLKNQTVSTNIILATSTPNKYIKGLCDKYHIAMYVLFEKTSAISVFVISPDAILSIIACRLVPPPLTNTAIFNLLILR